MEDALSSNEFIFRGVGGRGGGGGGGVIHVYAKTASIQHQHLSSQAIDV